MALLLDACFEFGNACPEPPFHLGAHACQFIGPVTLRLRPKFSGGPRLGKLKEQVVHSHSFNVMLFSQFTDV
jgi:hypothetical protein